MVGIRVGARLSGRTGARSKVRLVSKLWNTGVGLRAGVGARFGSGPTLCTVGRFMAGTGQGQVGLACLAINLLA